MMVQQVCKKLIKNSQPFGKKIQKTVGGGFFLTHTVYSVTLPGMKGVHTASHYRTLDADGTAATDLEHGCLRDASTKWLIWLSLYIVRRRQQTCKRRRAIYGPRPIASRLSSVCSAGFNEHCKRLTHSVTDDVTQLKSTAVYCVLPRPQALTNGQPSALQLSRINQSINHSIKFSDAA